MAIAGERLRGEGIELREEGGRGDLSTQKAPVLCSTGAGGGSYRDRTDDIHGVNVALYQLS